MPTYEYRREDGSVFEFRQGINEDALSSCPETGQKVTRMISGGGGVVYKGEGWYVTDYKKNGSGGSGKNAAPSDVPAGKKEPTKSETGTSETKETKND